jgi:hypothetical protein
MSDEPTAGVTHVAPEIPAPGKSALVAESLHRLSHAAPFDGGRPGRILRGGAPPLRLLGRQLEVQAQFLLQVKVAPPWTERPAKTVDQRTELGH